MTGFVTIHRAVFDHPLFERNSARLGAWLWLVGKACWQPTDFNIQGKTVALQRGQLCVSIRSLASEWGWSKSAVDRFITRLKTETMIETEAGHGRLILTICNYSNYQDRKKAPRDTRGTASGTAAGQQRDLKEQGNKVTREEPNGSSTPLTPQTVRSGDWPEIPEWMPVEEWNGFIAMRRKKRADPTARAVQLLIGKLTELKAQGHDPGHVLDQSTLKTWIDVYPIKDDYHGNDQLYRPPADGFIRIVRNELGIGAG